MVRSGIYTVEITDIDGNKLYMSSRNYVTKECKDVYMWEQQSLAIAIPSSPPFPNPMVLSDPFESNNANINTDNFEDQISVSKIEDKETIDGRYRKYKTTSEFEGPLNVLGFILYTGGTPYSAVNMPFMLEDTELMYVYYSMLMRW